MVSPVVPCDHRVTPRLGEEVVSVEELPDGSIVANLESRSGLLAMPLLCWPPRQRGRPELDRRKLDADSRGRIRVDDHYRTAQPHIFAVGDVIGFPSLASVSMEQGRLAACNAFGVATQTNPDSYPYGIYTIPEISFVGKTEEQLTDRRAI
ncbi:MAG: FAD-dependent oxidoreductase [Blastocatellia bacterium]